MTGWLRVSKRRRCPLCGRGDWCLISADGSAAICPRVGDGAVRRVGDAGYLHRLRNETTWDRKCVRRVTVSPVRPSRDFGALSPRYERAACDAKVSRLAGALGVSRESLRRLHVGWDVEAWTFPMTDESGTVTGIRRRFPDGRKLSVRGGREGLLVPTGLPDSGLLVVCEGPTDCAAMLTIGLPAVGRPSCRGGVRILCEFCRGFNVTILADADEPGHIGAWVLAQAVRLYCPSVRVIRPPVGVQDAREWLRCGGTNTDVQRVIEAAGPVKLGVTAKPVVRRIRASGKVHCYVR